jgi:hypothetical protein
MKNRANPNQQAGLCPSKWNFIHLSHVSIRRRRERPTYSFFLDEKSRKPKPRNRVLFIQVELHQSITRFHPSTKATATQRTMTRKTNLPVLLG